MLCAKGIDPRKDQSYFLFSLRQPQLRRALTPLGAMTKPQIREIAHSLGLKVADKSRQPGNLFCAGQRLQGVSAFASGRKGISSRRDLRCRRKFLGEHEGIEMFTIGQRKGLPGGSPRPRYVVDIDPATNRVIVGDAEDLVCDEFEIDRVELASRHRTVAGPTLRRVRSHGEDSLQPSRDARDSHAVGE